MHYLMEHELIEGLIGNSSSCQGEVRTAKITAEGLDFLEDDGGLSAILRTVTVKFDPDDLRQLLAAKINQIDLPAPQKKTLTDRLQDLPADLLKILLQWSNQRATHIYGGRTQQDILFPLLKILPGTVLFPGKYQNLPASPVIGEHINHGFFPLL